MKQIVVISGKGGTGKTVVSGSLAALAENKIMVDCDVDAANLHLLLGPKVKERHEFRSGSTAVIDKSMCNKCGECARVCRFGAINRDIEVEPFSCEGCGLCALVCPKKAIKMEENRAGEWFLSETRYGLFVHAKLGIAEENSGKLVSKIRKVAADLAEKNRLQYVIIDGPPGIGCPVIASLSGVDCALVVTEPSLSGLHDAQRVIDTALHFKVPSKLLINKFDLNSDMSARIEEYCKEKGVPVVGKIPFDKTVVEAVAGGKPAVEYCGNLIKGTLVKLWEEIKKGVN